MLTKDDILEELRLEVVSAHQVHTPDPMRDIVQIVAQKSALILRNSSPHALVCVRRISQWDEEYMLVQYGETPTTARMLDYWYLTPKQAQKIWQQVSQI